MTRDVGREQIAERLGHEIVHVVGVGASRALDCRVPDLDGHVARQRERGDADGIRPGLGVRLCGVGD